MARQIYRGEALQRLASPEQLDQLMPLTDPRGWLALAALGMVLAAVLVWACFGTVRVTVEAQGVLVRPGGVRTVAAPREGSSASSRPRPASGLPEDRNCAAWPPQAAPGAISRSTAPSRPGSWTSPSTRVRLSSRVRRW